MPDCPAFLTCTLEDILEHGPCETGWLRLRRNYPGLLAQWVSLLQILDSNGLDDALWALRVFDDERAIRWIRLLACDYAEHVLPVFECEHPDDMRPRLVVEVARAFAAGNVTCDELEAAQLDAWDAIRDVAQDATRKATRDAAWTAIQAADNMPQDFEWLAAGAVMCDPAQGAQRRWQEQQMRRRIAEAAQQEEPGNA